MKSRLSPCYPVILAALCAACSSQQTERLQSGPRQIHQEVSSHQIFKNRPPLEATAMYLLPLTSIRPRGWLERQLQIQANGLSGHLDEVWSDVGPNSAWLGGTGEAWERGPYFLDGDRKSTRLNSSH